VRHPTNGYLKDNQMSTILTLGQVGEIFGLPTWKVRRLYERGLLPEASRVGLCRVIDESDLPSIESALKVAGYIT
jgi:hypothetical protein